MSTFILIAAFTFRKRIYGQRILRHRIYDTASKFSMHSGERIVLLKGSLSKLVLLRCCEATN